MFYLKQLLNLEIKLIPDSPLRISRLNRMFSSNNKTDNFDWFSRSRLIRDNGIYM